MTGGSVVARGREKVARALNLAPIHHAAPNKTLHIESDCSTTSLVLAFFGAGAAPGFCSRGLAKTTKPRQRELGDVALKANDSAVLVLFPGAEP